jgi:hypothetical protein
MVTLQLYKAVFNCSTTGQLGFEVGTKFMEVDLVGINALNYCNLFSIPALLDLDSDMLLFLSNLLADAQLPRKATDSAHFRTHCVTVSSKEYKSIFYDMLLKSDGKFFWLGPAKDLYLS